jgi:LysR family transcriptional regulator, regulator of abg operon
MKLNTLRALVVAVEDGSLRGAARRLGVSQPALTKMIRELELELAAPLLVRTTRGVVPTAQGQVLYQHALRVSRELTEATDQIRQLGGDMQGQLNVGAVPVALMVLIPETLRTFCKAYPGIRLRIHEDMFVDQLQRLRSGQVDITVGGVPEGLASGGFVAEVLIDTTMVVVARKGGPHQHARRLGDLAQAPWVYTSVTNDTGYAQQLFAQHGLPPPPVGAVVNSTLALLALVGMGDYVGLLPHQIAQHPLVANHMEVLPLAEVGLPLQIGAIIRSDSVVSPAIRQFIAHLHRAAHHWAHTGVWSPQAG